MRTSKERWTHLSALLASLERCMEANARLDALLSWQERMPSGRGRPYISHADSKVGMTVERRINAVTLIIEKELDRLTAERLYRDLKRKKERAA